MENNQSKVIARSTKVLSKMGQRRIYSEKNQHMAGLFHFFLLGVMGSFILTFVDKVDERHSHLI